MTQAKYARKQRLKLRLATLFTRYIWLGHDLDAFNTAIKLDHGVKFDASMYRERAIANRESVRATINRTIDQIKKCDPDVNLKYITP